MTVIVAVTEIVSGQEAETEGDQDLEIGKNSIYPYPKNSVFYGLVWKK